VLTDTELEEIEKRVEEATEGPWVVRECKVGYPERVYQREINAPKNAGRGGKPIAMVYEGFVKTEEDCRFIAHYSQHLKQYTGKCDSLDDAIGFLKAGADWGELSYEKITDKEGNVLMDRDALFEEFERRDSAEAAEQDVRVARASAREE
jgi:hypothetical protein